MASIAPDSLSLERVETEAELEALVDAVFADPETRRGLGWTEADDTQEAMEAIGWLWSRRFEEGWRLYEVRSDGQQSGLAGLGPVEEDNPAWWAVYLLERGQGLGQRVGSRLLDRARREGAREAVACTWADNQASRAMLESLGFTERGPAPYEWARESELAWVEYRRELE